MLRIPIVVNGRGKFFYPSSHSPSLGQGLVHSSFLGHFWDIPLYQCTTSFGPLLGGSCPQTLSTADEFHLIFFVKACSYSISSQLN